MVSRYRLLVAGLCLACVAGLPVQAASVSGAHAASVKRGRYLVRIAGCNDCHTPGYDESGGKVPVKQWLVGSSLGWNGPWGTTYPPNLRLFMQTLSEAQWMDLARHSTLRPPMPWFALHAMSDLDLRSIYRFVRSLGPAGKPAPAYVPPGQKPAGPVVVFPSPPPAPVK